MSSIMDKEAVESYAARTFPGANLTYPQKVMRYLEHLGKTGKITLSGETGAKQENESARECPSCGRKMYVFTLCSQCRLAKDGFRSVWVCPASKGLLRKTSDADGAQTYLDFCIGNGLKIEPVVCNQDYIPDKNDHD